MNTIQPPLTPCIQTTYQQQQQYQQPNNEAPVTLAKELSELKQWLQAMEEKQQQQQPVVLEFSIMPI